MTPSSKEAARDGLHASIATSSSPCSTRSHGRSRRAPTSCTRRSCVAPRSRSPSASAGSWSRRAPASCPTRSRAGGRSRRPTPSCRSSRSSSSGLISNIDDKLLGQTRRHIPRTSTWSSPPSRCAPTSPTRRISRSARGASAARRAGSTSPRRYYHDVEPCVKEKIPVIWVNRRKETLESGAEEAHGRGQEPGRRLQASQRLTHPRCGSGRFTATSSSPPAASGRRPARWSARARRASSSTRPCCPTSSRSCPRSSSSRRFRCRACWPPTVTGTTCSPAPSSRAPRWAARRRRRRG